MEATDYEVYCAACEEFTLVGPGQTLKCEHCGRELYPEDGEPAAPEEPDPDRFRP